MIEILKNREYRKWNIHENDNENIKNNENNYISEENSNNKAHKANDASSYFVEWLYDHEIVWDCTWLPLALTDINGSMTDRSMIWLTEDQ